MRALAIVLSLGLLLAGCDEYADNGHDEDFKAAQGHNISVYFTLDVNNKCRGFITSYHHGDIRPKSILIENCRNDN